MIGIGLVFPEVHWQGKVHEEQPMILTNEILSNEVLSVSQLRIDKA